MVKEESVAAEASDPLEEESKKEKDDIVEA